MHTCFKMQKLVVFVIRHLSEILVKEWVLYTILILKTKIHYNKNLYHKGQSTPPMSLYSRSKLLSTNKLSNAQGKNREKRKYFPHMYISTLRDK